jgi:hypothetical protein
MFDVEGGQGRINLIQLAVFAAIASALPDARLHLRTHRYEGSPFNCCACRRRTATNLLARTYPAYSSPSASVSCPSVDLPANSSMRAWSAGSARKPRMASAFSSRTISKSGRMPLSNAAVSIVTAMSKLCHGSPDLAKENAPKRGKFKFHYDYWLNRKYCWLPEAITVTRFSPSMTITPETVVQFAVGPMFEAVCKESPV